MPANPSADTNRDQILGVACQSLSAIRLKKTNGARWSKKRCLAAGEMLGKKGEGGRAGAIG